MLARQSSNRVVKYFLEAREELRKVTWPNRREALIYSALVVTISAITATYFGLLDWLFTLGLEELIQFTERL